ncbi:MAG: SH3 domain-containing protein [bacterium]|nr:SH3 domain-containing protein [bacterium]
MKLFISLFSILALVGLFAPPAIASDCYVDPVQEYSGSATIKSAVFMRDQACMEGSVVLVTLASGVSVKVVGFTDGWYRVEWNGARGWIGQQFLNAGASQTGTTWSSYQTYMNEYPSKSQTSATTPTPAVTDNDPALLNRVRGYILLQVQNHGEAWYVDPISEKRYYMKDGPTAYQMMRSFGLGVTEADYARMASGDWSMKNRLRGRIILRVQEHGEAYYIHPKDLTLHYLQNGEEAYRVMRLYSLGIINADLDRLSVSSIPLK